MAQVKVAYICRFSTPEIRSHLILKSFRFGNLLRKMMGLSRLAYNDAGTWNSAFIKPFEYNKEFVCCVISHHLGMVYKKQLFVYKGVDYVFLRDSNNLLGKVLKKVFSFPQRDTNMKEAQRIKAIVEDIHPDIVVVCGAENPIYSSSILYIKNKPIFVILQTWLNSPKRIAMGVGNEQRRALENAVFRSAGYFGTFETDVAEYVRKQNPQAHIFRLMFPSSVPSEVGDRIKKQYDFVFFANGLTKNKGIEDALLAFGAVKKRHPGSTFCVIGDCDPGYMAHLNGMMRELDIAGNVILHGHFPSKSDALNEVRKAHIAVLPGITASFNSTVRETMFMGIPTIVYGNDVIDATNKEEINLLSAKKEDTADLGHKMLYALEHPDVMEEVAERAKDYAQNHFSTIAIGKRLTADLKSIIDHYYSSSAIPEGLLI